MLSPSIIDPVARNIFILTTTLTALMVLEYIWSFTDEVRLVWPRFLKTTEAKIYVATRYAGLAGQGCNIWFALRMVSRVPNSPSTCRAWYSYQISMTQCLLFSVELLLMPRVYKMYGKGKSIFALLIVFGGVQFAANAASARSVITGTSYSPTCVIISPHHSRIYHGVSIIVMFMFILFTMLWRFFRSSSGLSGPPRAWLKLAVRDGSCTTIAIMVIFIFMFLCSTRVINTQMSGNIIFYVLFSLLWFAVECKIQAVIPPPDPLSQAGRIVLHDAKFRKMQESQKSDINDPRLTQTIEVEPFDDSDAYPTSPSSFGVESIEVSTPLDSMSDVGTRDIADEHLCGEDDMQLSRCAPTFILIERCISGRGAGFKK